MVDEYGALPLPAPAIAPTDDNRQGVGDPALKVIKDFLHAVLIARLNALWRSIDVETSGKDIVAKSYAFDPRRFSFAESELPSLFVFTEESRERSVQLADDIRIKRDKLRIFWVTPPVDPILQANRSSMITAVGEAIDEALDFGCHPAFIVTGDADTRATVRGSLILKYSKYERIEVDSWHSGEIRLQPLDHGSPRIYPCCDVRCLVQKQLIRALPNYYQAPAALSADFINSNNDLTQIEFQDPPE